MPHVVRLFRRPRLGLVGVAGFVAVCISVLVFTPVGGRDTLGDTAAIQSQDCVLCGRAFADKLAQLCSTCDRGKCFKCGAAFPDKVARLCSSCFKNKCINCGRGFPDKAAKLCSRCAR